MKRVIKRILGAFAIVALALPGAASASEPVLFVSTGDATRAPIGWIDFCVEHSEECTSHEIFVRDAPLTASSWKELVRVNAVVNDNIRPMTDMAHYGVIEKWTYPEDGTGDCEDYALLKRRLLAEAGWPLEALLMTVVRERNGDGHAVLTVKTDRGDFILDNQTSDVLLWSETGYRFVKRQSQFDPNVWVALGDTRPLVTTASSR
jgi:predicted transglutaminase-like cysteine proteinase